MNGGPDDFRFMEGWPQMKDLEGLGLIKLTTSGEATLKDANNFVLSGGAPAAQPPL